MRKITLLAAILMVGSLSFAATGWFNDFLTIKVDGIETTNNYYIGDVPNPIGATALQGKAFGVVASLAISGFDMKYWSDTQDRTGGAFYYKITNTGNTVDLIATTEIIWDQTALGGNDFQGTKATNIDLLAGLPYGSYQLHVWAKSWGSGQGDIWLSNSSANYVATFTKAAPATALVGTYKVGANLTSDFSSLSSAFTALNANGMSGAVVLEITSDIMEPANIGLGLNTGGFGITIRPDADANRTITFTQLTDNSSPTGHFLIGYPTSGLSLAWSDANTIATSNVKIDGYAVGGSTRRLTFTNLNTAITTTSTVGARIIVVVGACVNTVIKNCIIENKTTNTGSAFCVGAVVRKGTAIEVAPTNLTIENNVLTALGNNVAMGMRLTNSGTLTAGFPVVITGLVIKNNIITAKRRLIELNYINGGEISGNTFETQQTGTPATVSYGLWTSTGVIGTIKIHNNKFLKSFTEETGAFGHRVVSLASGATYEIYNNTFAGMDKTKVSAAALNLTYLFYSGVAGKIYHNTFYMPALTDASNTGGYYRAINLSGNTAEIKNNIFISDEATHTNTSFISVVPTPASDYNVFYFRQPHTGATVVAAYATLSAYQAANSTRDINSKSVNVVFANAATGDLRIAGLSVQDNNLAVPSLTTVITDIFSTFRNAEFTYAGAHESTLPFITTSVDTPTETARIFRTSTGIQVEFNNESTIELYNMNGVLIDKTRTNGTYTRDLNNGVYIIRINGKATKFVK